MDEVRTKGFPMLNFVKVDDFTNGFFFPCAPKSFVLATPSSRCDFAPSSPLANFVRSFAFFVEL